MVVMQIEIKRLLSGSNSTGSSSLLTAYSQDNRLTSGGKHIQERIIINVGENTTRYCSENSIKLFKLSCVVLTSLSPQYVAGLPSLLLTLSSLGVGQIKIIGPIGIGGLIESMTPFTNRKYPILDISEIKTRDKNSSLFSLNFFEINVDTINKFENCSSTHAFSLSYSIRLKSSTLPSIYILSVSSRNLLNFKDFHTFISIIIKSNVKLLLVFPLEWDTELSVWEALSSELIMHAYDILIVLFQNTLSDRSVDIKQPQINLLIYNFLVKSLVPAPFKNVLNSLEIIDSVDELSETLQTKKNKLINASLINFDVIFDESFMNKDKDKNKEKKDNFYEDNENSYQENESISYILEKMRKVFPIFLESINENENPILNQSNNSNFSAAAEIRSILRTKRKSEEDVIKLPMDTNSATNLSDKINNIVKCYPRGFIENQFKLSPPNPFDLKLTFLGTGCAAPSKYRNSSGILINIPSADCMYSNCILLDCGEGVVNQMYALYSGNTVLFDKILLSISLIWISHHHADHHCGVSMLVQTIQTARKRLKSSGAGSIFQKILLIGSKAVIRYLEYSLCICGLDDMVDFIDIADTVERVEGKFLPEAQYNQNYIACSNKISAFTNHSVNQLKSIPVYHCYDSYGLYLKINSVNSANNVSIIYSGDCRPSKELQSIGKGCDLLIHEATFDDSMQLDALNKKHTTTSEALFLGKNMQAKHILLTHFSQRYPVSSLQKCETESIEKNKNYSLAFDFLTFSYPSQIDYLPSLTQSLSLIMENLHNKLQNQKNQNSM